jgi:hypothetical protein
VLPPDVRGRPGGGPVPLPLIVGVSDLLHYHRYGRHYSDEDDKDHNSLKERHPSVPRFESESDQEDREGNALE